MTTNILLQNKTADIVPDISLMKKMASISGTIPSRILELVDNSIDAKIENKVLTVDINIRKYNDNYTIEITDDGAGMSETKARSFFRLGDSQKEGLKKIGRFGLGAKVAIIGLGDTCKVETKPADEDYKISMDFDIREFKDWKIDYKLTSNSDAKQGTKVKISNITVRIGNLKRLEERLYEQIAKTYKHFLVSGDVVIRINKKEVKPSEIDLIPGLFKNFDFEVNGKRVHGWAGAMKKAGTNWKFGFDLINNGRIIKSNDLLSRQAHTSLARLTGEIHLDDFKTDIHKTDFLRDDNDFQEMQDVLMNEVLKNLIANIASLTNSEVFSKYEDDMQAFSDVLNNMFKQQDFLNQLNLDEEIFNFFKLVSKNKPSQPDENDKQPEEENQDDFDLLNALDKMFQNENERKRDKKDKAKDAGFIINDPIGVSAGEERPLKRWHTEEKEDGVHLNIEVNMDHPSYNSENDDKVSVLMKQSVIDSVSEFIVKEEKKRDILADEIERLNQLKDVFVRRIN